MWRYTEKKKKSLLLAAISLGLHKQEVVNVVVSLQRTFGPADNPRGAFPQVVAHQRLPIVIRRKMLVVSAFRIFRAGLHTFVRVPHKSLHVHGVLPGLISMHRNGHG